MKGDFAWTFTIGAAVLASTMVGTIVTHLFPAIVLLVMTAAVAWYRRLYE